MSPSEQHATGDRVSIETWDGGAQRVTIIGWEQVLCPIVVGDVWTDEQRAHYARLRYSVAEPEPFTIHPDDIIEPAKKVATDVRSDA